MLFMAILYESKFGKASSRCSGRRFLTYMPTTNFKPVHPWRNYESKHPQMYNVYVSSPTLAHDRPNTDQVSGKWAASEQQVSNPFGPVSYQHVLVISSSYPRRILVVSSSSCTAMLWSSGVAVMSKCVQIVHIWNKYVWIGNAFHGYSVWIQVSKIKLPLQRESFFDVNAHNKSQTCTPLKKLRIQAPPNV